MFNRFTKARLALAHLKANDTAALIVFARDTVSGLFTTAHHILVLVGLTAVTALSVMFVKPNIADQFIALSPFAEASVEKVEVDAPALPNLMDMPTKSLAPRGATRNASYSALDATLIGTARQQQLVTYWLSKRYRVAGDATNMLVSAAYLNAKEINLDPMLILAVMAIESGFNPFAESPVGAQGLMQVMAKVHHEKFQELGGVKAALNPIANIKVGSLILKDYVTRGGSMEAGLKLYVGAAAFESDSGYSARVLAEYHRLKDVAAGKNVPIFTVNINPPVQKPQELDQAVENKSGLPDAAAITPDEPQYLSTVKTPQVAAL